MATISLEQLRHSYVPSPVSEDDWVIKGIDLAWEDGGAYALLGSSGSGKTTILNLISGLLTPSEGRILFADREVTHTRAEDRNIAQVFQFPVVYDTMTVRQNLAFPLLNRGVAKPVINQRVVEIAAMLDLSESLDKRASGLTADGKQKISLGRGLVRSDVNAILFDEPLTVIDPHLKWQLRSKLKELHQQFGATMIYVTHDQTEALTFADQVVVMHEGMIVQSGTPVELFEKPEHTFVGHFIGSPGMNVLPGSITDGKPGFAGYAIDNNDRGLSHNDGFEIGIRPEFIHFADHGIPVEINKVDDIGRLRIVSVSHESCVIKIVVPEGQAIPERQGFLQFEADRAGVYVDGWLQKKVSSALPDVATSAGGRHDY